MYIDAEQLADGHVVRSDVTIVGAGPAGIVTALELERAGHRVALIESGQPKFNSAVQKLGDTAAFDPKRHAPMSHCTRRQIGGASAIWGGRCVPFDPIDFDERPYIPHASWPVCYKELAAYFQRACDYFFIGDAQFNIRDLPGIKQASIVPGLPDGELCSSSLERWSLPTDFGKEYRKALRESDQIQLVHGLTCTEIDCEASTKKIACIQARSLGGRAIQLKSSKYVIACGGLETTRLLLNSDQHIPGGIGNHSGLLGRFYMGHVSGEIANVQFSTPPKDTVFGFDRDTNETYVRRRFSFTREFQNEKELTNIVCYPVNPPIGDARHGIGSLSFAYLALSSPLFGKRFAPEAIRQSLVGDIQGRGIRPHLWNIVRDLPRTLWFIPSFGYKRFLARRKVPGFYQYSKSNSYPLHYNAEQVPNPESRVTLLSKKDRLGMRQLNIDLRYTNQDVEGVMRSHHYLDAHLQKHGCGHLEYMTEDPKTHVWEQARHGYHQCGTTRMSASPANGVVTTNCNVHGLEDLFVASSSVFVTSGQAGSTFMIVAFALRLAERLKQLLRTGPTTL